MLVVKTAFKANYGRYGPPRLWTYFQREEHSISSNTVAKMMKNQSLAARIKKSFKVVKDQDHIQAGVAKRLFKIEEKKEFELNDVWVGDITYIPINNKFLYLSAVMDLKRRKIVGWSIDETLGSNGVIKAFKEAVASEGTSGDVFHSDQGVQYKSEAFRALLDKAGTKASMSRKGNCYDNPFIETFFKTLKSELIWAKDFESEDDIKIQIFEFIEIWYNRKRIHTGLDNMSPLEYELELTANLKKVSTSIG
jgi:putative transposase